MSSAASISADQRRWATSSSGRAGGIRYFGSIFAGQPVADIVFGQQDLGDLGIDLRLVLAHPDDLGAR